MRFHFFLPVFIFSYMRCLNDDGEDPGKKAEWREAGREGKRKKGKKWKRKIEETEGR